MRISHSLEPWFDENSEILILGSLPSVKSREVGYYYGHPQNRFWKVLENIYNEPIIDKKTFCLKHHIALFDVIESCEIEGSSDSKIKDVKVNDLTPILNHFKIHTIITTGKKAYTLYEKYLYQQTGIHAVCMPSTSPANAAYSLDKLIEEYKTVLK